MCASATTMNKRKQDDHDDDCDHLGDDHEHDHDEHDHDEHDHVNDVNEQIKMRSRLVAQRMPFSSAHNAESIFS